MATKSPQSKICQSGSKPDPTAKILPPRNYECIGDYKLSTMLHWHGVTLIPWLSKWRHIQAADLALVQKKILASMHLARLKET